MMQLVVALPAEARPLIRHYRLRHATTCGGFNVHANETVTLVTSGPGKTNAAAASALLGARSEATAAWLNIGIAGHGTRAVGEGLLAQRIADSSSGQCWYPPRVFKSTLDATAVLTVDQVEQAYAGDMAFDMEASGYYPVASRFSSGELVQCYKVVSDNREHAASRITARGVSELIGDRLGDIDALITALTDLQQQLQSRHAATADLDTLTRRWHFTVSQRHQLGELARRWHILQPDEPFWLDSIAGHGHASEVLATLKQHLDDRHPVLQPVRADV